MQWRKTREKSIVIRIKVKNPSKSNRTFLSIFFENIKSFDLRAICAKKKKISISNHELLSQSCCIFPRSKIKFIIGIFRLARADRIWIWVIDDLSTGRGPIGNFEVELDNRQSCDISVNDIKRAEKGMHIQGAAYVLSDRRWQPPPGNLDARRKPARSWWIALPGESGLTEDRTTPAGVTPRPCVGLIWI